MADGTLRTIPSKNAKSAPGHDVQVQIDDSDIDMLEQGTLRILRVMAKEPLETTQGFYRELEVRGDSLPIVDVTVDPKRGMSAIVTVG